MSGSLFRDVFLPMRDALKARGVEFDIAYGDPAVPLAVGATRIVLQRDIDAGDQDLGPRGAPKNPTQVSVRAMGVLVRVFAKSGVKGAMRPDHEDLADQLVDLVQVALHNVVRKAKTLYRITKAGFVTDLAVPDGWAGVIYELRLQIDRGVHDVAFTGEAANEFAFASGTTSLDPTGPAVTTDLPNASTRVS